MSDDKIAEALGLPAPEPANNQHLALQIASADGNNDYEYARANMYELIKNGMFALEDLLLIAKTSESARAYEVVTALISTLAATNKDLMELAKKRQDIEGKGAHTGQGPVAGAPAGLLLTTAGLAALMKDQFGIDSRRIQVQPVTPSEPIEGESRRVDDEPTDG